MTLKLRLIANFTIGLLAACGAETADTPTPVNAPVGEPVVSAPANNPLLAEVATATYNIEPTHVSLVWKVRHNGLSNYTARFTDVTADLSFDAENPAASSLTARINPLSVRTGHPDGPDWDTTLRTDEKFFNAEAFPDITYASSSITLTGEDTGIINGELSLLGVTQQVPLEVTFNGVRNFAWFGDRDVIGFSATAKLKRSDFGMKALLPDIGDEVSIIIEAEFLQAE